MLSSSLSDDDSSLDDFFTCGLTNPADTKLMGLIFGVLVFTIGCTESEFESESESEDSTFFVAGVTLTKLALVGDALAGVPLAGLGFICTKLGFVTVSLSSLESDEDEDFALVCAFTGDF